MTFEPGKEYKIRDGRRARVYAVDGGGEWPVHGAILDGRQIWEQVEWRLDGSWSIDLDRKDGLDLMPPEPEKITRWVPIVNYGGSKTGFDTQEQAQIWAGARPYGAKVEAIIPVTFHRGEGLE